MAAASYSAPCAADERNFQLDTKVPPPDKRRDRAAHLSLAAPAAAAQRADKTPLVPGASERDGSRLETRVERPGTALDAYRPDRDAHLRAYYSRGEVRRHVASAAVRDACVTAKRDPWSQFLARLGKSWLQPQHDAATVASLRRLCGCSGAAECPFCASGLSRDAVLSKEPVRDALLRASSAPKRRPTLLKSGPVSAARPSTKFHGSRPVSARVARPPSEPAPDGGGAPTASRRPASAHQRGVASAAPAATHARAEHDAAAATGDSLLALKAMAFPNFFRQNEEMAAIAAEARARQAAQAKRVTRRPQPPKRSERVPTPPPPTPPPLAQTPRPRRRSDAKRSSPAATVVASAPPPEAEEVAGFQLGGSAAAAESSEPPRTATPAVASRPETANTSSEESLPGVTFRAARTIQAWWRGELARAWLDDRVGAVLAIQSCFRSWSASIAQRRAVLLLQSVMRGAHMRTRVAYFRLRKRLGQRAEAHQKAVWGAELRQQEYQRACFLEHFDVFEEQTAARAETEGGFLQRLLKVLQRETEARETAGRSALYREAEEAFADAQRRKGLIIAVSQQLVDVERNERTQRDACLDDALAGFTDFAHQLERAMLGVQAESDARRSLLAEEAIAMATLVEAAAEDGARVIPMQWLRGAEARQRACLVGLWAPCLRQQREEYARLRVAYAELGRRRLIEAVEKGERGGLQRQLERAVGSRRPDAASSWRGR